MGLIAMARHLQQVEDFKKIFVEVFGMSVEEAKEKLSKENEVKPFEISDEIKSQIQEKNKKSVSPEELVESFAAQTEEFYPNGKPQHN